ncbi:hydroxyacid dehydrogenase, partial [candidate division WWE3 bacterium]|nr:hydroxyacid dehydrogenase [candidate division WWE3 bacterium]
VDIKDKTIAVIGGGHIGMNVVKIANGFGMNVLVYDVVKNPELALEYNFTYVDELSEILSRADFVSLHAPLNTHTFHLLNKEMFCHIKQGAYLINTARGGLVETDALLTALKEERIAGAGLDVLEGENYLNDEMNFLGEEHTEEEMKQILEDQMLMDMENVIITPHIAFNTDEAHLRIIQTTIENIKNFIEGTPNNTVS